MGRFTRSLNIQRFLLIGLSGPVVALNIWLLSQVYRYFEGLFVLMVSSAILAFLLNYLVRLFERMGIRRTPAVAIVLFLTVAFLLIVGFTLVPVIVEQSTQLLGKIPAWLASSQRNLQMLDNWAKDRNLPLDLQGFSGRINAQLEQQLETLARQAVSLAIGTLSGLVSGMLVLVLTFYMLLYGQRLWNGLIGLLPPHYGVPFSESLQLNFHYFFISQLLLALFMTAALIPVFLVLKVPFALLFAIFIGITELIPLFGAALGIGLVFILVALQDLGLAVWVGIAAVIAQQIRDNILGPKMMGDFTGLNPIWVLVALLIGLQVAGFLGVVVAVPIAGTIKTTLEIVRTSRMPPLPPITPPPVVDEESLSSEF